MSEFKLTEEQISSLARGIIEQLDSIKEYYKDPENERKYREWYKERYGCYPKDEGAFLDK